MISKENYKTVNIHIITFKASLQAEDNKMNERRKGKATLNDKFICSICLNNPTQCRYPNDERRISKARSDSNNCEWVDKPKAHTDESTFKKATVKTRHRAMQTLPTEINKDLNLLNEILTVFQNKQHINSKLKHAILKDASISTDDITQPRTSKLSVNKLFRFSIDEANVGRNNKCTIITSHDDFVKSQSFLELPKHKASSIPQMKVEELKYSIKEKTQSKDAVEEVNRMFATVRRSKGNDASDNLNRPSVRSGPRILPVVQTKEDAKMISRVDSEVGIQAPYRCCQNNDWMSSGDSCEHSEFRHHKQSKYEKCDKCVYMMCCHYRNSRRMRAGIMSCDRCRNEWKFRCDREKGGGFDGDS